MGNDKNRGSGAEPRAIKPRRWLSAVLWVLAVILMLGSAVYQRLTGPTHPLRGSVQFGDSNRVSFKLIRSEEVVRDARVELPAPSEQAGGTLFWRRFKTGDEFTAVVLQRADGALFAKLPAQPPAGKLEYYLEVSDGGSRVRIPEGRNVVIRYKGVVPPPVLLTHVILMFFAVLWGIRTLIEALFVQHGVRWMAWTTIILMTAGGLIMGPIVQQYAFGAAWTGVPFGWDLTDNKVLLMWLCWLIAVLFIGWGWKPVKRVARLVTIVAAIVMIGVYLIPHSMYGSELDYGKVDQGVDPLEAIGQG